jgi:hypothetical protein
VSAVISLGALAVITIAVSMKSITYSEMVEKDTSVSQLNAKVLGLKEADMRLLQVLMCTCCYACCILLNVIAEHFSAGGSSRPKVQGRQNMRAWLRRRRRGLRDSLRAARRKGARRPARADLQEARATHQEGRCGASVQCTGRRPLRFPIPSCRAQQLRQQPSHPLRAAAQEQGAINQAKTYQT